MELVAAITVASGLLLLVLALFRMGWISQFLSRAVITGFLFGAAIDVVVGELPKLTGTEAGGDNNWQELWSWVGGLADAHGATLLVGIVALVVIVGLRFVAPRLPGALIVVAGGLVASALLNFDDLGITLVGPVPSGFAPPRLPTLSTFTENGDVIWPAALGLLLIGFSQTAGDPREFATRHRYRVDINQEATARGVANIGSGILQGIPVSTSLSASSLNEQSGARTPMASLVTGALVVLTLLLLAPLFADLPQPVLSAVIIDAVVFGMMNLPEMKRLRRVSRVDFWIAVAAIVGVVVTGVLAGVIVGVALSVVWLVHVSTKPGMWLLGRAAPTQVFRSLERHPDDETHPGVVVLAFDGDLFFASAAALDDRVRNLVDGADPPVHTVVLDFEGVNFVDSQGSSTLEDIADFVNESGAQLRLARVKSDVRDLLERDAVIERIGSDQVYGNIYEAMADQIAHHEQA